MKPHQGWTLDSQPVLSSPVALPDLATGKYYLVARTIKDREMVRPLFWDVKERSALINEGVSVGLAVEVKSGQSTKDLAIKIGPNGLVK